MPDLHERLTAAVNARLEVARAARHGGDGDWSQNGHSGQRIEDERGEVVVYDEGSPSEAEAEHIAANDPATVIRHSERDLRVLERHTPFEQRNWSLARGSFTEPGCEHCELTSNDGEALARDWPCDDIQDLVTAYGVEVR